MNSAHGVRVLAGPPFCAAQPARLTGAGGSTLHGHLSLLPSRRIRFPYVLVWQDDALVTARRFFRTAYQGSWFHVPLAVLGRIDAAGGDVVVTVGDDSHVPFVGSDGRVCLPMVCA